jgi:DNA-binding transcriptional LysR family regulator
VSLVADVLGAETLLRELLAGNLDLGFLFDAPQSPELMVAEAMPVSLIMVSSRPGLTPGQAVATDYVMVDWGTAFTIAHARRFRDMPAPRARVGLGRMAQALLLARGGTAYLAEAMVRSELANGQLHRVADAPVIQRVAYAVYTVNSRRRDCIEQILGYFAPGLLPSG